MGDRKTHEKETSKKGHDAKTGPQNSGWNTGSFIFICNGAHRACPQKQSLNTLQAQSSGEEPRMGACWLLNAI